MLSLARAVPSLRAWPLFGTRVAQAAVPHAPLHTGSPIRNAADLDEAQAVLEAGLTPHGAPPTSFEVPLYSVETLEPTGATVTLDGTIFGVPVRPDILHQAIVWKLACRRLGTARTKNRSMVVGSKSKIAPQKGRGEARVGPKRSPIRRGGGKAHGKVQRDFSYSLPKKVRRLALRCALAAKFAQNKLRILESTALPSHRTRPMARVLERSGLGKSLIVDGAQVDVNLYLATRNLPNVSTVPQYRTNVYDILRHDTLLLAQHTLPYLADRVNGRLPTRPRVSGYRYRQEQERLRREQTPVGADDVRGGEDAERAGARVEDL